MTTPGYARMLATSGQKAEIWRRGSGTDRFGQPTTDYGDDPVHIYPCRVSYAGINASNFKSGEMASERYVDLVGETRLVFLPDTADVSERDQVRVVNNAGDEILPMTSIYSVRPRYGRGGTIHHTEIVTITYRDAGFQHAGAAS